MVAAIDIIDGSGTMVIWYHLYNLKNVENTRGGVLLLVKLWTSADKFTKSNTPPRVFSMFFKLYKWYQIAQRITYDNHPLNLLFLVNELLD